MNASPSSHVKSVKTANKTPKLFEISQLTSELKSLATKPKMIQSDKDRIVVIAGLIDKAIKYDVEQTSKSSAPLDFTEVLRSEFAKFKEEVLASPPASTYASALKSATKSIKPAHTARPAIIISSTSDSAKHDDVLKNWRKASLFKTSDYAPSKVAPVSKNKVRVEFENAKQRDEVLSKLKSVNTLKSEPAKQRRPMVILFGMPKDISSEEVLEQVLDFNPVVKSSGAAKEEVLFKFKRNNKNPNLCNIILEVSPKVRSAMLEVQRVKINDQRIRVKDFSPFLQCFKCLQFGHTQSKCKSEKIACSHCASDEHLYKDCPSKSDNKPRCYNCKSDNAKHNKSVNDAHSGTSMKHCPVIKSMAKRINVRVDHGL